MPSSPKQYVYAKECMYNLILPEILALTLTLLFSQQTTAKVLALRLMVKDSCDLAL
jgi:hypothetical protein